MRLHQASAFYGVASTVPGSGSIQREGPEAGLHERAGAAEICTYYQLVLTDQLVPSGRVEFHQDCEHLGDGSFVSRLFGQRYVAGQDCRIDYTTPVDGMFICDPELTRGAGVIGVPGRNCSQVVARAAHARTSRLGRLRRRLH